jgi:integrase
MESQQRSASVLNDVKTADIQGFLLKLKDDGLSGCSLKTARTALRAMFKSLAKESKLEEDVVEASKIPVVALSNRKAFTADEVRDILRTCSPLIRPVVLLAASTGMRRKDCCLLKWGDVRLDEGIIAKTQCKTGRQVRIPLSPAAHQWLTALKSEAVNSKDSAFVLPEAAKEYHNSGAYRINSHLMECLGCLGLEHNQTITGRYRKAKLRGWHSFRDFFLTTLANSNIPIHLVGQAAGHTSLAVTGTYLRTSGQTDEVVRKALPALDYEPTITVENQP